MDFTKTLTPSELKQLAEELIAMSNRKDFLKLWLSIGDSNVYNLIDLQALPGVATKLLEMLNEPKER